MGRKAITISVPDQVHLYVEARVRSGGYGSVSEYFRDLLREDRQRQGSLVKNDVRPAPEPERTFQPLASAARRPR